MTFVIGVIRGIADRYLPAVVDTVSPLIAGQFKGYTWADGDCVEAELPDVVEVTVPEDGLVATDVELWVVAASAEVDVEVATEVVMEELPVVEAGCDLVVVVD